MYSEEQLEQWREDNKRGCTIDGKQYTTYQATQLMRKLELKIRQQKDTAIVAKASGDDELRRECQGKIKALTKKYTEVAEKFGLKTRFDKTRVEGYRETSEDRKYQKELAIQEKYDKMVSEMKASGLLPKNAKVNIPPTKIDVKTLAFDDKHINVERKHNVTREMAETWIKESKMSATVWNGRFERYYSKNGATYVDTVEKEIRTAFSKQEFDEKMAGIMEVLEKYGY